MTRKKSETERRVCYVRLSEFYACYYKTKYGGEPIVFSEDALLSIILEENIVQNPDLRFLTKHCYSWLAFNYERQGKIFDIEIATPGPDERSEFIEVELPETVYRRGKAKTVSGNWQLCKAGAERFREQVKRGFWQDCRKFIDTCQDHAKACGEHVTMEACISDFMLMYNIPMAHFENMLKHERRIRKKLPSESKRKRDFHEQKTGNVFIYT